METSVRILEQLLRMQKTIRLLARVLLLPILNE